MRAGLIMGSMQQASASSDEDELIAELVQWLRDEVAPVAQQRGELEGCAKREGNERLGVRGRETRQPAQVPSPGL